MCEQTRERWNRRYQTEGSQNSGPSQFLCSLDHLLPTTGSALDVAGGSGTNAIWLAQRGLDVTLVDISDAALARAQVAAKAKSVKLALERRDLEASDAPTGPWHVIIVFNFLWRPLLPALCERLVPGGLLVVGHPTGTNLERHRRPSARFLLEDGELPTLIPDGLERVVSEEGWQQSGRHEARLVVRRRN